MAQLALPPVVVPAPVVGSPPPVMPQPVVQQQPPPSVQLQSVVEQPSLPAIVPPSPSPVESARVSGGGAESSVGASAAGPSSGGDGAGEEATEEELLAKLAAVRQKKKKEKWTNSFVPLAESFSSLPAAPSVTDSAYHTEAAEEQELEDEEDIPSSQPRTPPEDAVGDTSHSEMDLPPAKGKSIFLEK